MRKPDILLMTESYECKLYTTAETKYFLYTVRDELHELQKK
jgi:hypothetical protein